jgi:hypothetical protein
MTAKVEAIAASGRQACNLRYDQLDVIGAGLALQLRTRAAPRIVGHKRGLFWERPIQVDAQGEASLRTWFGAVTCRAPAADIDVGSSRSYCTPIDERQLTLRKGPL